MANIFVRGSGSVEISDSTDAAADSTVTAAQMASSLPSSLLLCNSTRPCSAKGDVRALKSDCFLLRLERRICLVYILLKAICSLLYVLEKKSVLSLGTDERWPLSKR